VGFNPVGDSTRISMSLTDEATHVLALIRGGGSSGESSGMVRYYRLVYSLTFQRLGFF